MAQMAVNIWFFTDYGMKSWEAKQLKSRGLVHQRSIEKLNQENQ